MARRKPLFETEEIREVVIYCRVSTDEQASSGLGLEAQERRCRAWAEASGLDVAGIFVDAGISAKTLQRPELERAIETLKPGRVLVAYKLDRLTRTVSDLPTLIERIEAKGADWATVEEKFDTSTAAGRMMLNMMLVLSQFEREQTGERTKAALSAKKDRKERLGTTPLGYRTNANGELVEDPEEMATVRRAREMRNAGLTLRAIAAKLTEEGHRTKRGGQWAAATVQKLLATRYVESLTA